MDKQILVKLLPVRFKQCLFYVSFDLSEEHEKVVLKIRTGVSLKDNKIFDLLVKELADQTNDNFIISKEPACKLSCSLVEAFEVHSGKTGFELGRDKVPFKKKKINQFIGVIYSFPDIESEENLSLFWFSFSIT